MKTKLIHGDCLKEMFDLPDNSIDMVCCDMPYGTTACKWDTVLPLDMLWHHYKRICKNNAAIVLNASQPFTTTLINSNQKWFKYELIWDKTFGMGQNAKRMPIKIHENILIFYNRQPIYNPQMTKKQHFRPLPKTYKTDLMDLSSCTRDLKHLKSGEKYPVSVYRISSRIAECNPLNRVHPTQKPVTLVEYLIKTYTNEGDTVLDNCMGSGTTGVACKNLGRDFIGIELDKEYFEIAKARIEGTQYNQALEMDGQTAARHSA